MIDSPTSEPHTHRAERSIGARVLVKQRAGVVLPILALLLISSLVIGSYIPDQRALSPFDEWVYSDYVDKLTSFDVPQRGELVDEYALEVSSCRGVFVWGVTGSPCGGPYVSTDYPMGGVTSADIHPPTYFATAAAGGAVIRALGLSSDILTSARIVGALWLFAGLLLVVQLARELGAPTRSAVGAAAVLAALPIVRYTNSYITPDAANIAVGAVVLLAALRADRGMLPWWSLAVVGAFAGAIKTQNALVIGASILFLLWQAIRARQDRSTRVRAAGALFAGFVLAQLGWLVTRGAIAVGPSPEQGVERPLALDLMLRDIGAFIFRLGLGATEDGLPIPAMAYPAAALLVAGCVGAVIYRSIADRQWALAAAVTTMVFLGSPLLMLAERLAVGDVVPSPTRYGSSLLPGLAAVTASAFASKRRSSALCVAGIALSFLVVVDNVRR